MAPRIQVKLNIEGSLATLDQIVARRIQVNLDMGGSLATLATTLTQVVAPRIQVELVMGGSLENLAQPWPRLWLLEYRLNRFCEALC